MGLIVGIFLAFLMVGSAFMQISINNKRVNEMHYKTGDFNQSASTLSDQRGATALYVGSGYRTKAQEEKAQREMIETALVRTCRALSTMAHAQGCANWDKPSKTWQFVGNIDTSGSLDPVWTQSATAIFDCGSFNDGSYGRGLMQSAIPASEVSGRGYRFDFTGVSDNKVDPCGYTDIVGS